MPIREEYHYPVDPGCPEVEAKMNAIMDDPMSAYCDFEELLERYEREHRRKCRRCQEYGAANVDIA